MLLVNKTQRIIQLAELNPENPLGSTNLLPVVGTIELSAERWEKIKFAHDKDGKPVMKGGKKVEHPIVKALLEEGHLEEIDSDVKKALSDLKPRDALEVIASTVDAKMLAEWKKTEKRKPVLNAIAKQEKRLKGEAIEEGQDEASDSDDEDQE